MANTESLTSIPERRANLCSRLLFTWYTPLTSVQINTASDVWKTPKEDSSLVQTTLLEERLEYQKKLNTSPQRQLLFALVRTRGWEWLLCSFLKLTGMYSNIFNLSFSHPLFAVCVCVLFCAHFPFLNLSFVRSFVCSFILQCSHFRSLFFVRSFLLFYFLLFFIRIQEKPRSTFFLFFSTCSSVGWKNQPPHASPSPTR